MLELISDFAGTLFNVLSSILFSRIILKEKVKIKPFYLLFSIVFVSIIMQVFYFLDITVLKTSLFFLVFFVLFRIVFLVDYIKAIILSFFYIIIEIFSDMISLTFLFLVLEKEYVYEMMSGSFVGNIIVLAVTLILTLIFRKLIYKIVNIKLKYSLIFMLIVTILCIIVVFYSTYQIGANAIDNILGLLCVVIMVIILSYSLIQVYKNNQLTEEYDKLLEFIKKYEVEIDNQRILRHETKNQLLTIKSKIIDKDKNEAIINYINEIIKEDKKVKHSEYAKFKSLPSNGIKGLFYFKVSLAQDKKIKVSVNISKEIEKSFLGELDGNSFNQIGKVLGVYLDNAIEGAEGSNDKIIGIEIFVKNDDIVIIISNSYNANSKFIGRSTKGVGRGYGLLLANNIINSTKKLESFTEVTDSLYIKKLVIKK